MKLRKLLWISICVFAVLLGAAEVILCNRYSLGGFIFFSFGFNLCIAVKTFKDA